MRSPVFVRDLRPQPLTVVGLMSPEKAIAKIREIHEELIGDPARPISREVMSAYLARVWAVLDFTEKPRAVAVTKR